MLAAAIVAAAGVAPGPAGAANVVSFSGVLRAADGKPVHLADIILTDLDDPTNTASVWSAKNGAYFLLVRAGARFRLRVRFGISGAAGTDTIILPTATFTTTAPLAMLTSRALDLTLPALRRVTINITDPESDPVQGAEPLLNTEGTASGVELSPGIAFGLEQGYLGGNRNLGIPYIRGEIYSTTNSAGATTRWSFPGVFTTVAFGMGPPPYVTHGTVAYPPIEGSRYTQQLTDPITIDVSAGNTTVNIQRPRLSTISGILRTADGKPVHLADIILTDLDDPTNTASVWTSKSGTYSLRVRSAPNFRLRIRSGESGAAGTDTVILPSATFTTTAPLSLNSSRTLNLTLPALRQVTIHITDNEGNAVKGADPDVPLAGDTSGFELAAGIDFDLEQGSLGGNRNLMVAYSRGEIYRTTNAFGNTTRWSFPGAFVTPAAGMVPYVYATVRYPSISGFRYEQRITDPITVDVSTAGTTINIQRPELVTLSGVLRAADGRPVTIADIILTDLDDPTNTATVTTKSNGAYLLLVRAGSNFQLKVRSGVTGATGTSTVVLPAATFTSSSPFTMNDPRVMNLTLPPLRRVTIRVTDADDNPIAGADPTLFTAGTASGFELATGVMFGLEQGLLGGNRNLGLPFIRGEIYRTTNASGNATRWSYAGAFTTVVSGMNLTHGSVRYPAINGYRYTQQLTDPITLDTSAGDATITVQSDNFATIDSAGSLFGDVTIVAPDDTALDDLTTTPVVEPEGVPDGAYVLAGDIEYSVTDVDPGASVNITIALPAGATVSHIGKIIDNMWTAAPPDRIISKIGNRFTVRLTDGGWGDADGTANGVIVDPLVPLGPCRCSKPGAPGKPVASIGDHTITLRWTGAAARGAAVRDHVLTYATSPTGPWVPVTAGTCAARPVRTRTCTVTDLDPGTAYWFRAAAVNARGRGSTSLSVRAVAATLPGTVGGLSAAATTLAGSTKLTWAAAPGNGASIRRYEYSYRPVGVEAWGLWRSVRTYRTATVAGLTPDVSYEIRVRAVNVVGAGDPAQITIVA